MLHGEHGAYLFEPVAYLLGCIADIRLAPPRGVDEVAGNVGVSLFRTSPVLNNFDFFICLEQQWGRSTSSLAILRSSQHGSAEVLAAQASTPGLWCPLRWKCCDGPQLYAYAPHV